MYPHVPHHLRLPGLIPFSNLVRQARATRQNGGQLHGMHGTIAALGLALGATERWTASNQVVWSFFRLSYTHGTPGRTHTAHSPSRLHCTALHCTIQPLVWHCLLSAASECKAEYCPTPLIVAPFISIASVQDLWQTHGNAVHTTWET